MKKLNSVIGKIEKIDGVLIQETQKRLDNLTKPQGSLGRLEELAKKIVGITGNPHPPLQKKVIFTLAGDHGVAQEGVSAFPQEVTPQMVYNFIAGGAAINVLARQAGARVVVVDMGVASKIEVNNTDLTGFKEMKVAYGTKNMLLGAAMSREEAIKSIENGIQVLEDELAKGIDIVGTGDMGIANTTASSAIAAVITGRPVEYLTGRGTGIDDKAFLRKISVIKQAIALNRPNPRDPIDVLAKVGGFEIGGLTGIILAAASRRIPVVIDGFISAAGMLLACQLDPKVKDYLIAGHCSVEKGHKIILDYLGLTPLLELDLRLGEGTGAALAMHLVEAAVRILTEMATFQSAGVSEKTEKVEIG
ncbi:MAG: nicotinate-nucleotide--dimethylbenzimidazole phosphoribosyltransferase [Candidatus Omnitrophota bacterium]